MKKKTPKLFNSYPEIFSIFVAIFISGLLLSEKFTSDSYIAWLGLALGAFVLSFFLKNNQHKTVSLLVAALFSSMFYGSVRYLPETDFSDLLLLDNSTGTLSGRYTGKSNRSGNKINYTFDKLVYQTNEQEITLPIEINCRCTVNRERLYPEQYYSMTGTMRIIDFDKRPTFNVASFTNFESGVNSLSAVSKTIQGKIIHGLTSVLKKEHAAMIAGFILGDTAQISDKSIFTETGVSHLLAISGQHIMILVFLVASILHWFKIPPISRSVLISIMLAFYATVTVGSPSIWRALIMYISVATVIHLESASSPIRPISIAAFIMLLYDPALLKSAAFVLSFIAVLSIIFLRKPFEFAISKLHMPDVLSRYLAVTFAANIGTMPMVAYLFGTVSISALIVNPLILWTFTFILPTAFFIAILSMISIPLAVFLSPGLSVLLDTLLGFLEYAKSIPGMYFYVGNMGTTTIIAIYSLLLLATTAFNKWQIKILVEKAGGKPNLTKIPVRKLPGPQDVKICIDQHSKAMPTLLGKEHKTIVLAPDSKPVNPFTNPEIVGAMDDMISDLPRIPNNNLDKSKEIIPVNSLSVESQNLYYRLFNMNRELFKKEPERLLQAHIFMLALPGYEILNRISSRMNPPLSREEMSVDIIVKDRYLTMAILADSIMNSFHSERVVDTQLAEILEDGRTLYQAAQEQLRLILNDNCFDECIENHLVLREKLAKWCWRFVQRNTTITRQRK